MAQGPMRNPAEGPMREPKNAVPLRSVRSNANADAKEVLDNFMNAPANLKRKSENTKAAAAAAAAKQPRIERAQPRMLEVKSRTDHQNKLAASARRATPASGPAAPSSSASAARARASSSSSIAASAKAVTP